MAHVIGCDVGSQSLKGVLVDTEGANVADASASYELSFPQPGWAEQDPDDWLRALRAVVSALLERGGIAAADVGALGLASQVDGVVAVNARGHHLRPTIVWMDRRAEAQCRALGERIPAQRIFDITGLNLDSSHVAPEILWLRDKEPEAYRDASAFLLPGSYLVYRLTGEMVVDYSIASSTMLYDVQNRGWSKEMLAVTGIDEALLGRVDAADK